MDTVLAGSPDNCKNGKIMILLRGRKFDYDDLERAMKSFCGKYKYAGESGSGSLAKLMMNFIGLYNIAAYAQTFRLTESMGSDGRVLEELTSEIGRCLFPTI